MYQASFTVLTILMAFVNLVQAQTYTVHYEREGFKGYVTFEITKSNYIFKDGLSFHIKNNVKNTITDYKNGQFNTVLSKAGIRFPITLSVSTANNTVDLTGNAYVYLSPQRRTRHQSQPAVRISLYDGFPQLPDFSEDAKNYVVNYAKKQNSNLWTETGGLENLQVKFMALSDLKNQVETAIRKDEQAQEEKKQVAEKQRQEQLQKINQQQTANVYENNGSTSVASTGTMSSSSATANHTTSGTNHTTSNTRTTISSNGVIDGPYKDPELNRKAAEQKAKMEETQRKVAAMKAQLARTQQQAANLDRASDQTFEAWQNGGDDINAYIQGAKPLVNEFAKQGNVGGAITAGAVGVGLGILKSAQANKAKKEAAAAEQAERDRIRREEEEQRAKFEAEQARLRQEAFDLLIGQRYSILEVFSDNEPIPLSTTKVASDKIYYFIYAIDPASINQEQTSVYVSNVFEIAQYHDGTWPYQSAIEKETQELTPYNEVLQGYYLEAKDAMAMRQEFINGFRSNKGVSVIDIVYKEPPAMPNETRSEGESSVSVQTSEKKSAGDDLGIPIGGGKDKPTKASAAEQTKAHKKEDPNGLGIPLNL